LKNMYNLEKLEFNQILKILEGYVSTYVGKNIACTLMPKNDKKEVKKLLKETEEAVNLVYRNGTPGFYETDNMEDELKILEVNSSLSAKSLLTLNKVFIQAKELKEYFDKDFLDKNQYEILKNLFENLYTNNDIIQKVSKCIIDENTIDDRASSELNSIRKRQRKLEQDIRNSLNNMIHSSRYSKYIQENIITIRNDRFVIPIKEEYRGEVKGFIHDISNGGSTVFIEPISVFEMNNELSKLKANEEYEIEKILRNLTELFTPYIENIKNDLKIIGRLDFIFAKAMYSKDIKGITPIISDEKQINLINARHPLIDKEKVVPISIKLGKDFKILLITGPNTGGKTVSLKTVGLLCTMACCGLNIPADEKSEIYVFDNIFADIGDDQSIADSLSTFSSHMVNIAEIIKKATSNSLVLVDELGSGTDPIEGANLAMSILDYFKKNGSLVIATTHYQELKQYALVNKEYENASVEFNVKELKPTYKLLIGIPGKSNAFEISKNLGIPEIIIENAKNKISKNDVDIEELLKNIYINKSKIEKEKEEINKKLANIVSLEKSLIRDNEDLKKQEQELINNAKVKARNILLDAKEEANEIIKKLNDENANTKIANKLRNELNKKIKENSVLSDSLKIANNENQEKIEPKDIKPNTEVFVKSLRKNGTVLSHISKDNEVQVQIGILKMNLKIDDLQKAKSEKNNKDLNQRYTKISKTKNVKTEINVIGMNVDEAVFIIDKYLDDCTLANLKEIRIVHGKGTGKLREGIQAFLKTNMHVKSYRIGNYGEGEMGVTVVQLK